MRKVIMTEQQRLFEAGWKQGWQEGQAAAEKERLLQEWTTVLLGLFELRRLRVSKQARARIKACREHMTLVRWCERAVTAQSAAEAISDA